ncbi:MAG TPA: protein kinase [Thermoanaerobaculia bacterium]|nr:protein kinase [Thermoanaerobaculia bacterium]
MEAAEDDPQQRQQARWRRLDALFEGALALPATARGAYLAERCGDDPALRAEVEELLACHGSSGVLDQPAPPLAGPTHAEETPKPGATLPPGAPLGPYQVVLLLGAGGMGEVYRARDPRLGREVAIKVIRGGDPSREALRRFDQEARAASALNHSNLLVVYDVGSQDGVPYVVTELLEGETLRERLRRGPLPLAEALALLRQALAGLAVAHQKGIVHRDLKPENLFLTADGRLKILDFGLAKRLDGAVAGEESLTGAGTVVGTVGYTAPEQLGGQPAVPASDLFSLGAVLYEALSGRRAFAGATSLETLSAVLTEDPPPLRVGGEPAPPALATLVRRCLVRRPQERYASVAELLADLDAFTAGATPVSGAGAAAPRARTLAVLPFLNLSGDADQEYFCEGLAEELIHALSRLEGLRVAARSSSFRFKGQNDALARVARELRVETVLEGSLRKAGERLRINVQLVDIADGCHLWSERYDRAQGDVFAVQEEIAARVVEALRLRLTAASPGPRRPANLEAYHHYLRGRHLWNKRHAGGLREGAKAFEQAIELDPGYAQAWAGLADSYALLGHSIFDVLPTNEAMPRAKAAALRALELDPGLAAPHAALGWVRMHYDWDWVGAERDFQRAIELDPRHATTHHWYSFLLSVLARADEAIEQSRRAWELDPLSLIVNANVAQPPYYCRQFGTTAATARRLVELEPTFPVGHYWLGLAHAGQGDWDQALPSLRSFLDLFGATTRGMAWVGLALARTGDVAGAAGVLGELEALAARQPVPGYHLALVQLGLDRRDAALASLERACDERCDALAYLAVDPLLDPLRGEPRFDRLLDRVGLRAAAARARPLTASTALTPSRPRSVAVLPFRDLLGDAGSEHLGLGLADATITELAHLRAVTVRPTSAILRFATRTDDDAVAAGRQLTVDSVVDGSFQRAGGRLRVTVQLLATDDGAPLWSTKLDAAADDLFAVQDEVARNVAAALAGPSGRRALPRGQPPAGAAYDLYLQGRTRLLRDTLADNVAAINCFERARDADPAFALAWAGLADAYARLAFNFQPEGDWYARAAAACEEALRLDPALPEGRYAHGRLRWSPQAGWDHGGAIADLYAALAARPGFAEAHQRLGTVLYHVGLIDEGTWHLEQAVAISPSYHSGIGQLAFCRYHRGDFAAALRPSLDAARAMPAPWDLYQAALCHLRLGGHAEAAALAERIAAENSRHGLAAAIRGLLAAARGDFAAAREEARQIVANREGFGHYHHAEYDLACIRALLADTATAVDELASAAHNGYPCGRFFAIDPLLTSLHGDAGFAALLAQLEHQREGYARLYAELQAGARTGALANGTR